MCQRIKSMNVSIRMLPLTHITDNIIYTHTFTCTYTSALNCACHEHFVSVFLLYRSFYFFSPLCYIHKIINISAQAVCICRRKMSRVIRVRWLYILYIFCCCYANDCQCVSYAFPYSIIIFNFILNHFHPFCDRMLQQEQLIDYIIAYSHV